MKQGDKSRGDILEAVRKSAKAKAAPGASAARSQDFLFDADGLPDGAVFVQSLPNGAKGAKLGPQW
jgi:hypothetical protein